MSINPWPVNWSAAWTGALSLLAASLIFGLIGTALGASAPHPFASFHTIAIVDLVAVVLAAFFASVVGGWVAGRIAGYAYAEPSILHGAIAWLIALPLLLVALAAGAGSAFGGWYGGLVGVSPLAAAAAATATAPEVVRGSALAALTTILIGLIGAVLGGWLASGEPMSITYHKHRPLTMPQTERRPN